MKDLDMSFSEYLGMMMGLEKKTVIRRLNDDNWLLYQLRQLTGLFGEPIRAFLDRTFEVAQTK